MQKDSSIYVAGHTGMVGSALVRLLKKKGYINIITRSREDLDLLDQKAVQEFFATQNPEYVFMAAGKQGGIYANTTYRADFIYENTMMQANVIHQSFLSEVRKLLFFACSCIYPKICTQPMREEDILGGHLEPTNEPFALAKLTGMKMCEAYNRQYGTDFMSLIPTNIYGPTTRYANMNSLVVPSLIRRIHKAKETGSSKVELWGSGKPSRDFLFVDDLAKASLFLMEEYGGTVGLNIGTGKEYSIAELAGTIKKVIGFEGEIYYNSTYPDGVDHKLQDTSKINSLGWSAKTDLESGIKQTYKNYLDLLKQGHLSAI